MSQNTTLKIPSNWLQVVLSDLFLDPKNHIVDGPFGSNLKASEYKEEGIPVLRIQNIDRNRFIDKNINYVTEEKAEFLSRHSFIGGDIIITKLGAPVGKACFVPAKYDSGIIVADLIRVRIDNDNINEKFLLYQINSSFLIKQFEKFTKGTTRPRINLSIVRELKFNLPPIKEQQRIVSVIEELFSDLDNGVANLKLAQKQLKVYRQALLKYAFEGKLLPNGKWKKILVDDIGDIITGGTPSKRNSKNFGDEFNFYKPGDLNAGFITSLSKDRLSKHGYENSRHAPANSILVTCIGATIGKTGYIRIEGAFNQQINAVVPNSKFNSKFIFFQMISSDFQERLKSRSSSTTLPIINKSKFSRLDFYTTDIESQNRIVESIEYQFSLIDKLEESINTGLLKSEALRHSILKKAFEGKLVDQDSNEESAIKLLKRIIYEKKEYLQQQKLEKKKSPQKIKKMSKELSIEEVLKTSNKPMLSVDVWQQSCHKDNIEEFYAELKKIQENIKEVKNGTESLISLKA